MNKSSVKNLVHSGIVNAQKLVGGGYHINFVWLALSAFFIKKSVNGVIFGTVLENNVNDLKKCFAKMWRAAFGNASGLNVNVSGLVRRSVKPGKSGNRFTAVETACIANLCDQLRSENFANTEHLHNNVVFGNRGRYSRVGGKEHMIEQLHETMEDATTERQRSAIHRCMEQLENE